MRYKIWPYSMKSKSAKDLANALSTIVGYKVYRTQKSQQESDVRLINWGSSQCPEGPKGTLNFDLHFATNKLAFFQRMEDAKVRTPRWTSSYQQAVAWVKKGYIVYARKLLNAHSGKGIVICKEAHTVPHAPLYTLYVPSTAEYRIHVFGDEVLFRVKKAHKQDFEGQKDEYIRSIHNGWAFVHIGTAPACVIQIAKDAVKATGLQFGAVDVLYNSAGAGLAHVLEVNTAPGLGPNTCNTYAKAIANESL